MCVCVCVCCARIVTVHVCVCFHTTLNRGTNGLHSKCISSHEHVVIDDQYVRKYNTNVKANPIMKVEIVVPAKAYRNRDPKFLKKCL